MTTDSAISLTGASSNARIRLVDSTRLGRLYHGSAESFFAGRDSKRYRRQIQLILTSPPFPLNRKKKYGNYQGEDYIAWLAGFAPLFRRVLAPNGSIVIEMGNSWEKGHPVMSTLATRALLRFMEAGKFYLCEQFVSYNSARLPSPAQWVNVERIRVKDAFTHVWWMSPSPRPKADNTKVLRAYSASMQKLIASQTYNYGVRPSEHRIGKKSFLKDNGGSIPSNVLEFPNTASRDQYLDYCKDHHLRPHPARMPAGLAQFFIEFLTDPKDRVLDPFAGSNTTGVVAERLGRKWASVELKRDYVDGARSRLHNLPDSPRG